eukprot:TRINITY_DN1743_c0_g1_i1.p1 TRINITY_DN1743_c0_g1~~TRINITY_DN1743_c0_g1_i1.p1  ORF type:complete len:384 (-),score=94.23 TRINITY_DN1743_c0_g1_i1:328-1479(-)
MTSATDSDEKENSLAARQPEFIDAVKKGDYSKIKRVLDQITNELDKVTIVNFPISQSGSTALFTACWEGQYDICQLLILNGAKINWVNVRGNTALHMAVEQNHPKIAELLLQNGATGHTTKLAAELRKKTGKTIAPEMDKLLEEYGNDLKKKDEKLSGILNNSLGIAIMKGDIKKVKEFLRDKQMRNLVQETDSEGNSLLFHAAAKGYSGICKELMAKGAEINLRNKAGNSPLTMAIAGNHFACVKYLLEKGANTYGVNMRYIRYWSPCNITKRIDNLLKKFPPKDPTIQKKNSPLALLSPRELAEYKKFFDYYDTNHDGFITLDELSQKLGKDFTKNVLKRMMELASSAANCDKISFEDFVVVQRDWDREKTKLIPQTDELD